MHRSRQVLFRRQSAHIRREEPSTVLLPAGGDLIPVRVRRSARAKRISLRVSETRRDVVLVLPGRVPLSSGLIFLERQANWIAEQRTTWAPSVPLAEGSLVPLRDVPHRIRATGAKEGPIVVSPDPPELLVPGPGDRLARRIVVHLMAEARRDLETAVARHAAGLGVGPRKVRLGDPKSRWGSCSAIGMLNFSWRLILAPPAVLSYVAAHEVAHLLEMNHGPRFWALVERLDPDHRGAELWLKRNGAGLHRFTAAS